MLPRWVYIYLVSKSMITERMSKDYQKDATIAAQSRHIGAKVISSPHADSIVTIMTYTVKFLI